MTPGVDSRCDQPQPQNAPGPRVGGPLDLLAQTALSGVTLEVEITEIAVMSDPKSAAALADRIPTQHAGFLA
jgi:hypothetical protein